MCEFDGVEDGVDSIEPRDLKVGEAEAERIWGHFESDTQALIQRSEIEAGGDDWADDDFAFAFDHRVDPEIGAADAKGDQGEDVLDFVREVAEAIFEFLAHGFQRCSVFDSGDSAVGVEPEFDVSNV